MEKTIKVRHDNQKYFLFKIKDVLNNGFHSFEAKRMESVSLCLKLCVDTAQDIASSHNADLLINAYKSLLSSLKLLLKYHPFGKLESFLVDNRSIVEKIDKYINSSDNRSIADDLYKTLCAVYKKLEKEAFTKYYVEIMIKEEKVSYQQIDDLIGFMISDLLYQGYSMQYLREWYNENIMTQDFFDIQEKKEPLDIYVSKFLELTGEKKCFKVYIKYKAGTDRQQGRANEIIATKFMLVENDTIDDKWSQDTKYPNIAMGKYWTCDFYKAARIAEKQFCQVVELYHMSVGAENAIVSEHYTYGISLEEDFNTTDIRKNADVTLISFIDRAKKQQYDAFIELLFAENDEDFDTLDRVLHTLYNAKSYNVQNRFLNFWSSLEYLVHPFPRKSIIEKARIIVPELLSMFYIKDKMNVFWERFIYHYNKKNHTFEKDSIIIEFYNQCKSDVNGEYNTYKIIQFLMDEEKSKKYAEEYKEHCVIVREFRELYMLINDVKKRNDAIEEFGEIIRSDLNIIYRMRNQLIHSGGSLDDSFEYVGLRLYKYVNAILSTILFYKRKNNNISISEILFSIDETFLNYMKTSSEVQQSTQEVYRAIRPKYMYIE